MDERADLGPTFHSQSSTPTAGISRRQFLQLSAVAGSAIAFAGCKPPPGELVVQSRVRLAEDLVSAYDNWYATACGGCGAGCGIIVRVVAGRAKKVEGNPDHPLNLGRSCARAQALVQEQYHPDRIPQPLLRGEGRGAGRSLPLTWDEALSRLVSVVREVTASGEPGRVAVLTPTLSGHQALVMSRFTQAMGARWLRLDPLAEAPVSAAVRTVYGLERLPRFDIQNARFVLSFGADFLSTWLSPVHYGVQYGAFRQGWYERDRFNPREVTERPRGTLVQIEPRMSMTAANADEWIWIHPGREGQLALSLAQIIVSEGLVAPGSEAIFEHVDLSAYAPELVASDVGIPADRIRALARAFASQRPSLALAGGPAASQTNGTEAVAAVLALNALVGSVGAPGGVLATPPPPLDLPAATPASSIAEWQILAADLRAGRVNAVLVASANPVFGLPAALRFEEALRAAPFIVSFSSFRDATTDLADLVLPTSLPLESWGSSIPDPGSDVQTLTMRQPVVRPYFDTRSVWDVLPVLAEELGGAAAEALPWDTFQSLLREDARRLWQGTADAESGEPGFERFWTGLLQRGLWTQELPEAPITPAAVPVWTPPVLAGDPAAYPYYLIPFPHNTLRDGSGAHLPWLASAPDPVTTVVWRTWVEINPRLAEQLRLGHGDLVTVETTVGRAELPVYVSPAAPSNVLAVPMGWGHQGYGRWADGRGVNPLSLVAPLIDRATGALAYAATRARMSPTGRSIRLPRLEGDVPAYQLPDEPVLQIITLEGLR
ncbi:MAG: molybdopterin-dependent oxidoreductase [Chloroflexota bacterium]